MPETRQTVSRDAPVEDGTILVRSLGLRMPPEQALAPHAHPWPQLVLATEGVLTVSTSDGHWVVPPARAVWIPARFEHAVRTTGHVWMRTVYPSPVTARGLPETCRVVSVTPLLRELIREVVRIGMLRSTRPEEARLAGVLMDQLRLFREEPLRVTWPRDPRARRVADRARAELDTARPLAELASGSGASPRTVERLFRAETGLPFGRWLARVRCLYALERLAAGDSVTEVALAVGYDSTSAFIAMFKRTLGHTPGQAFASATTGGRAARVHPPRPESS